MNVLAFDTASPLPSAALFARGRALEERLPGDRRASEELLPAIQRLLTAAGVSLRDCGRIAVCSGPGSFTGVRLGLATAWGLGRALGISVESVPTLQALAEAARAPGLERVAAALEAGRGEVVVEFFSLGQGRAHSLSHPQRLPKEQAIADCRGWEVICLPEALLGPGGRGLSVSPAAAMALAVARDPRETAGGHPMAIYSRASAAEEKLGAS